MPTATALLTAEERARVREALDAINSARSRAYDGMALDWDKLSPAVLCCDDAIDALIELVEFGS
jgi:hypothetical protein